MENLIHIVVAAAFAGVPLGLLLWGAVRAEREEV